MTVPAKPSRDRERPVSDTTSGGKARQRAGSPGKKEHASGRTPPQNDKKVPSIGKFDWDSLVFGTKPSGRSDWDELVSGETPPQVGGRAASPG